MFINVRKLSENYPILISCSNSVHKIRFTLKCETHFNYLLPRKLFIVENQFGANVFDPIWRYVRSLAIL